MKKGIIVIILLINAILLIADIDTLWTQHYGGSDYDWCNTIIETHDYHYLMSGIADYSSVGDLSILKTTSAGDTIWKRSYGGIENEEGYDMIETSDGNYLVVGRTASYGAGNFDMWAIKIDTNGDTLWTHTYGGTNYDYANSVIETADSNYLTGGRTNSFPNGYSGGWLVKINAEGDTLWMRTYDYELGGVLNDVIEADSNNYIAIGLKNDTITWHTNAWIINVDNEGDIIWNKDYGSISSAQLAKIIHTDNNCYMAIGTAYDNISKSDDLFVIKFDCDGDTIWTRMYGCPYDETGKDISKTADGGFLLGGCGKQESYGTYNVIIVKIDSMGNEQWTQYYGGVDSDGCYSMYKTSDDYYLFAGYSYSYTNGQSDMWLIKGYEGSSGISFKDCELSNYCIKQSDNTSILLELPDKALIEINIYDIMGRLGYTKQYNLNAGLHSIPIETGSGVFFVNVQSQLGELYSKMICIE